MTPDQLRANAQQASVRKQLAVRISRDGETWSAQYFQHRASFEDFMNRALHQGYTIELITEMP